MSKRRTEVKDGVTTGPPAPDGVLIVGASLGGNYLEKALLQGLKLPPGVHHVEIAHDAWCGIFSGRACNCDPDVVVRAVGPTQGGQQ